MSFERIAGLLFSGFMVKLYAAGIAIYFAIEAATYVRHAFAAVSKGFGQ